DLGSRLLDLNQLLSGSSALDGRTPSPSGAWERHAKNCLAASGNGSRALSWTSIDAMTRRRSPMVGTVPPGPDQCPAGAASAQLGPHPPSTRSGTASSYADANS